MLGGLDVYVVDDFTSTIGASGTKDPADLIKESPKAWLDAVEKKRHIVEVMLAHVMKDEKDDRKRGQRIVAEVLPFIRAIQSPIDRAHFIKVISGKTHIPESTLTEELNRGVIAVVEEVKQEVISLGSKERLTREIIAFSTLTNKLTDKNLKSLSLDMNQFPEAILQEEMFKLEEKVTGDKDKYFNDLIATYKKLIHKEEMIALQKKLNEEGVDYEAVMKEINDHAKKGIDS